MKKYSLYKKNKNGRIQKWSSSVFMNEDGTATISREMGVIDGKFREKNKTIKTGKNIGKANETSTYEQAVAQAEAEILKKIKDNYVDDISKVDDPPKFVKPALAKTFKFESFDGKQVAIQPKKDGCRCVSFRHLGDDRMISRECEEFTAIKHIKDAVDEVFRTISPDGEIYLHGLTLQETVRRLRKYRKGKTEELEYHVFDMAMPNLSFSRRYSLLKALIPKNHPIIKLVPTFFVDTEEEIKGYHDTFTRNGFEGTIIRNPNSEYGFNERNENLQKYKEFVDREFKIVGHKTEVYNDPNDDSNTDLIVWICKNDHGGTFSVRPKGSVEERAESHRNAESFYGKMITVKYQGLTEDGSPIFPVGLCIRDYE